MFPPAPVLMSLFLHVGICKMPTSPGPLTEVFAIRGGRTLLPCDVTPSTPGDAPILVLFYNGATGLPIYSIDARSGPLGRSIHWSGMGGRAHFDLVSTPSGLVIDDVDSQDRGLYRCRVDFRASPTRNVRVELLVVVPPRRVTILAEDGREVTGVIGPYPLGGLLTLTCQVTDGSPRPWVAWWHEGSLLDDVVEEVKGQISRNVLSLPNLSRQHLYRVLTCMTNNSNLTMSLAATVTLDMSFPPLEVSILEKNEPLTEGLRYSLACEAGGSRPPAVLTWWIDGMLMTDTKHQVTQEGQVSRSTLHLVPSRSNNGAVVSCRADNPRLEAAALEDSRKLIVYYSPRLHLRAGQTLNMSAIKEGDDVYFECDIQANPSVFKVQWFLNGLELHQNATAGVIQSNQSLVLQGVGRGSSGLYTCKAVNSQGSDTSNALHLNVKFSPVCASGQKWVYGGRRHQPVNVTCRVEAHPEATTFRWAFNTSSEFVELPPSRVVSGRSRSLVEYTPQTHHDFGSLLCWGRNHIDLQHRPCVFHVVPAGVPEAVSNCSAWHNGSAAGEVVVSCQAGWSGGLAQTFTLQVRQAQSKASLTTPGLSGVSGKILADGGKILGSAADGGKVLGSAADAARKIDHSPGSGKLLASLEDQHEPHFTVSGLEPGSEYHLVVVASNAQGPAQPAVIAYLTPIDVAEKQTSAAAAEGSDSNFPADVGPVLGVVVGVAAFLLVSSVVVVVVVCTRAAHTHARAAHAHAHAPDSSSSTKVVYDMAATPHSQDGECKGFVQQQQPGPDIILIKSESAGVDRGLLTGDPQQGEAGHVPLHSSSSGHTDSCSSGSTQLTRASTSHTRDLTSAAGIPPPSVNTSGGSNPFAILQPPPSPAGPQAAYHTGGRGGGGTGVQGQQDMVLQDLSAYESRSLLATCARGESCYTSI